MSQHVSNPSNQQEVNAPFRAKSAAVSLFVVLLVGLYYVANAIPMLSSSANVPDGTLNLVIIAVALIIVVEVVLQIVLFIGAGRVEAHTDHDDTVTAQASRNAYRVLTIGTFATFGSLFFGFTPFQMGNILLIAFLVAEVVKFGSQIAYYGRSA